MEEHQIKALKGFANLIHGNASLTSEIINILKQEVQPGGEQQPYEGSHYCGIMTYFYVFKKKHIILANCKVFEPSGGKGQRTPSTAIRQHFESFYVSESGNSRGAKTYVPPYFCWFCSLPAQCEKDEKRNRRDIAKKFYNNVLEQTPSDKIPKSLKKWDDNYSPPWIDATPHPVFHTWKQVYDAVEGKCNPDTIAALTPDNLKTEIKRDLLDPYNPNGIPFFGRENEIRRLNDFAYDKAVFKIWTVIAPSGAGKTRLVFEWTQREAIKEHWEVFYLGQTPKGELVFHDPDHIYKNPHPAEAYFKNVLDNGSDWQYWSPDQDTILIIDYVSGFEDTINAIVNRCVRKNSGLEKRVRLLVLDHVFPASLKELYNDDRWLAISDIEANKYFYDARPLHLEQTHDQYDIIESIIRSVALRPHDDGLMIELTEQVVEQAVNYLEDPNKNKGTWHPLFAALVGDALRCGRAFDQLDRRKLIESYLIDKKRLPWQYPEFKDKEANKYAKWNRLWASAFVCAATLLGGVKLQDLFEADYTGIRYVPDDFGSIKTLCQRVISKSIDDEIPTFIPDIIAESFFLLLLKKVSGIPDMKLALFRMLDIGEQKTRPQRALTFVTVIERLARNLLNDDQSLDATKNYWTLLLNFLQPGNFRESSVIRWAVSAALFDCSVNLNEIHVTDIVREKSKVANGESVSDYFYNRVLRFLSLINENDLHTNIPKETFPKSIQIALQHDSIGCGAFKSTDSRTENIIKLLKRYSISVGDIEAFFCAAYYWNDEGLRKFINTCPDLNITDEFGFSPLMAACCLNYFQSALDIIERNVDINLQSMGDVNSGYSALMWALRFHANGIASELIKHGADVHLSAHNGDTPLSLAMDNLDEEITLEILEEGWSTGSFDVATIENAFFNSSGLGWNSVICKILKNKVDIDCIVEGFSALHIAILSMQTETVKLLIDNNINYNAVLRRDGQKFTPLDLANGKGNKDIINILLSCGAKCEWELMYQ